jgi:2,3-bisphosphoglycerate-dependent phosphoglycerate mutase
MPRLVAALLRHGEYQQPRHVLSAFLAYPLNDTGKSQARDAATAILDLSRQHGWQIHRCVDTSQLLRAWQTGTILARQLAAAQNAPVEVESFDALAERCVGSAANLTIERIEEIVRMDPRLEPMPDGWRHDGRFRLPFPGAETMVESGGRVAAHLDRRMRELAGQVGRDTLKLFVGHGGSFRYAAARLGVLSEEQVSRLSMWHCSPVFLEFDVQRGWSHLLGDWKVRSARDARAD